MSTVNQTCRNNTEAPVIYVAVDEDTVLALSTGLHDQKCRAGMSCPNRNFHAMDCFGDQARNTLNILASTPWPAKL